MASEKTEKLLSELASVELYRAAGTAVDVPPQTTRVADWGVALDRKRLRIFENVKLEAQGDLTVELSNHHMARYRGWNALVREIRPRIIATFEARCTEFSSKHGLSGELWSNTRWDILGACMECEFSDLVFVGFYDKLAKSYLAGHFPCGWTDGIYPTGQLEIY
jgi:hypothetical protein